MNPLYKHGSDINFPFKDIQSLDDAILLNNLTMLNHHFVLHSLIIVSDPCSAHQGVHFILPYHVVGSYIKREKREYNNVLKVTREKG